ncbi:MAG: hypothetical protein IPJ81_06910 [Chitinophagaceae bacterium]|nr:hypothetical protein [Chitinophagaceae bacterium]
MNRIKLPNVCLVLADCYNYGKAVDSLQKSMKQCEFAAVKFLTDIPLEIEGIEVVQIPSIKSKEDYSDFVVKELYKYFDTDYVLVTQHDAWVLDGSVWGNYFLNYDYIGAPWLYQHGRNVGNGGFSLRSKKLQTILGTDDLIDICHPEDQSICILYGDYLKGKHGIKFAPEHVADRFAYELREPASKTFGFHGYFHEPYKPTVILKRSGAIGDIVILEPIMRHFYMQGYNVVLDIPADCFALFEQHYFPIKHISQFDIGRIKPEKEINLDMAYEVKPCQNYQKSYFEFCGIKDYTLTRPILWPLVDEVTKPFKKYVVIHNDDRSTPHRNILGVDWKKVQKHLEALGYFVLQIGSGNNKCGQHYNTFGKVGVLKWLIAGCDFFIGEDSAPAGIAVAYNKPCILFFGSVNPDYIHPDLTNVEIIQSNCDKAGCWHIVGGTKGQDCAYFGDEKHLQCCKTDYETVIDTINKFHQQ